MSSGHTASPQTTAGEQYSTLERLLELALTEFGHTGAGPIPGEVVNYGIFAANQALEEVMKHPYWTGGDVDYYVTKTDRREVPDPIMVFGMANFIAQQQGSSKMNMLYQKFSDSMNKILLRQMYGAAATFEMKPMDKG